MSLPPESQQFVGSALDPADPRTSIFMAGSERISQPFTGTYSYNPNISSRAKGAGHENPASSGISSNLVTGAPFKLDTNLNASHSAPDSAGPMLSPFSGDGQIGSGFIDFSDYSQFAATDLSQTFGQDQSVEFDTTPFLNDLWGDESA
jgi:hypothetical protein